jgi:hypothetical protein
MTGSWRREAPENLLGLLPLSGKDVHHPLLDVIEFEFASSAQGSHLAGIVPLV